MEQAISSDLIRGHLDTIILHTLIENDKYAQQISDAIALKSNDKYQINQATLYSSLKRLESQKYVSSYWNDADDGRRKYFKITELGKQLIDKNLSNWSYSRAIIDKLMDSEPEKEVQIVYKERIVQVPVEQNLATTQQSTLDLSKMLHNTPVEPAVQTVEAVSPTPERVVPNTTQQDAAKEANFRNILNGLINSIELPVQEQTELSALNTQENVEKLEESPSVLDFNQTISDKEYVVKKDYALEKIDYSDLIEEANQEGFKINVSSKESVFKYGKILINKLNFISAILMFFLMAAEFALFGVIASKTLDFGVVTFVVAGLVLAVYPVMCGIIYAKKTNKSILNISTEGILISFIVLFNVALISLACNFVFSVDFGNLNTIAFSLILPIALSLNAMLYYVFRFLLSKSEFFKVK